MNFEFGFGDKWKPICGQRWTDPGKFIFHKSGKSPLPASTTDNSSNTSGRRFRKFLRILMSQRALDGSGRYRSWLLAMLVIPEPTPSVHSALWSMRFSRRVDQL